MSTQLTVTAKFRWGGEEKTLTYWYEGEPVEYRGCIIRKNTAGSYDGFIDDVLRCQYVGIEGTKRALDEILASETEEAA